MGVEDVRAKCFRQFFNAAGGGRHLLQKHDAGRLRQPIGAHRRAMKAPPLDVLDIGGNSAMPWRGELQRRVRNE